MAEGGGGQLFRQAGRGAPRAGGEAVRPPAVAALRLPALAALCTSAARAAPAPPAPADAPPATCSLAAVPRRGRPAAPPACGAGGARGARDAAGGAAGAWAPGRAHGALCGALSVCARSAAAAGVALSLVRRRVAPWLREPRDLDEARGFQGSRRIEEKRGVFADPIRQKPFKERMRDVTPYQDIADEVESKFFGKGGMKRARHAPELLLRPGQKKFKPTALDQQAESMKHSRFWRFAAGPLHDEYSWPDPDPKHNEVAFAGRSNVGKSSLLNKLAKFGTVAKVSAIPGETKKAVWYRNNKLLLDVIDMPGYGHADRAVMFGPAAIDFVTRRTSLKALYVLIDARHGFKRADHDWLGELGKAGPMKQIVLTKCDLVAPKDLIKIASLVRSDLEGHKRVMRKLLMVCTPWGHGLHELRQDICKRCNRSEKPRSIHEQETGGRLLNSAAVTEMSLPPPGGDGWDDVMNNDVPDEEAYLANLIAESKPGDEIRDPRSDIRRVAARVRKGKKHI